MRVRPLLMVGALFSIPVANMNEGVAIKRLPAGSTRGARDKTWRLSGLRLDVTREDRLRFRERRARREPVCRPDVRERPFPGVASEEVEQLAGGRRAHPVRDGPDRAQGLGGP